MLVAKRNLNKGRAILRTATQNLADIVYHIGEGLLEGRFLLTIESWNDGLVKVVIELSYAEQ